MKHLLPNAQHSVNNSNAVHKTEKERTEQNTGECQVATWGRYKSTPKWGTASKTEVQNWEKTCEHDAGRGGRLTPTHTPDP